MWKRFSSSSWEGRKEDGTDLFERGFLSVEAVAAVEERLVGREKEEAEAKAANAAVTYACSLIAVSLELISGRAESMMSVE